MNTHQLLTFHGLFSTLWYQPQNWLLCLKIFMIHLRTWNSVLRSFFQIGHDWFLSNPSNRRYNSPSHLGWLIKLFIDTASLSNIWSNQLIWRTSHPIFAYVHDVGKCCKCRDFSTSTLICYLQMCQIDKWITFAWRSDSYHTQ